MSMRLLHNRLIEVYIHRISVTHKNLLMVEHAYDCVKNPHNPLFFDALRPVVMLRL